MTPSPSLSFRQERFALEYLKDQNASAAAARAGYQAKNMAAQGHELLNNPAIRERVRGEMEAMLAEIRCWALALMKQRMKAAFFDAGKLFKAGWELRSPEELDDETRAAVEVSAVTRRSGPVVRMKQPDRNRALRALEKVHERLDRLNEAHYAALEKAGLVPTLEEIEAMDAMDAAEVPAGCAESAESAQNAEKCRVLSGGGAEPVSCIPVKTQVLSGSTFRPVDTESLGPALGLSLRSTRPLRQSSGQASTSTEATAGGCEMPEKPPVLSGSAFRPADLESPRLAPDLSEGGTPPIRQSSGQASAGPGRTVRGREIPKKTRVLSGSPPRLSPLAAAIRGVTQARAAM